MADVELWVPVVRVTEGPMAGSWSPDVPMTESAFPAVGFAAAIPMAMNTEEGGDASPALVSTCRIIVDEDDAEEITSACTPSDLDYALVRACADIPRASAGEGLDGERAREIFGEIAQHVTATGDERIAILRRALPEATWRGLPFESAQAIAGESGLT